MEGEREKEGDRREEGITVLFINEVEICIYMTNAGLFLVDLKLVNNEK